MECSTLKLIIEKGPREGETLEYSSRSVVKIGRVVRGNTIAIKDAGISSKHISIQFDNETSKWNLTDLDSSNGTILNGEMLPPNAPSTLNDGDCIKIGELTSILVKIELQSIMPLRRNPRRQGKTGASAVAERDRSGLGLGLDADLGEIAVDEPVQKRNPRPKNEVENMNSKRTLRSSKIEQIPEDINADAKRTERGRGRGGGRGRPRKGLLVEQLEELQISESVRVDAAENVVQNSGQKENLNTIIESAQDQDAEKLMSTQEGREEQEAMVDQSLVNGSSEVHVDKETTSRWQDLEKMTIREFFDYLELYLPKEIHEKTDEITSQLSEKSRIYSEARLRNEKGKG